MRITVVKDFCLGMEVDDIVISGVSGRYPNSDNLDEFWENLISGKILIIILLPYTLVDVVWTLDIAKFYFRN